LAEIAGRLRVTPDAVAIAAVLSQPWADTVLSGAVSPGQLASNLRAPALQLTDQDLDQLASLAEPAQDYWSQRTALQWR
jgi:aryl-alcohol dehydrogenase-like predicted oxidoreductase